MNGIFIELPSFEKYRDMYFNDTDFLELQSFLLKNPLAGKVVPDTGGIRKLRVGDARRNKGKQGGIRIMYYWYVDKSAFLLLTIYDKDEKDDLTKPERHP